MISQVFIKCNATSHLNNCENLSIKYCDENPNILTHFIPAFKLPDFDEVKILKIQINFWNSLMPLTLYETFAWQTFALALLVKLPCLREHVLRAYCTFASKQAVSITLFDPRPNKKGSDRYLWSGGKTFMPCAARTITFQRENFKNYLVVCFTQCTLFVQYVWFLLPTHYLWDPCNEDECCALTHRAADIPVASLGLFTFARIACLLQLWIKASNIDYSIWATPR